MRPSNECVEVDAEQCESMFCTRHNPEPLAFTSNEVIAIINGGCLCTIGRGTCQLHGESDRAPSGANPAAPPDLIGPDGAS